MSKQNCTDPSLCQTLESHLHHVEKQLEQAELTAMARQSGFLQRSPRKIPILKLA